MSTQESSGLDKVFPFEYVGGGYFRKKGVAKGKTAEILHGEQAIAYVYGMLTLKEQPIKEEKAELDKSIEAACASLKTSTAQLKLLQERCPHLNKESWTNDDGDGSFIVERCLDCGLQKDGGLRS